MTVIDTSVAVAALATWHPSHAVANAAAQGCSIVSHGLTELFSVLTRLPAPHRLEPGVVHEAIGRRFPPSAILVASASLQRRLVDVVHRAHLSGGAVYDGIIAAVAHEHRQLLLTLDRRAARAYEAIGVDFRIL